jgi:hypothetical protein
MTTLIAIGYPDEVTAYRAAEETRRMAADFRGTRDALRGGAASPTQTN